MVDGPELSRPVRLDTIGGEPRSMTVTGTAEERAALARRFGLLDIAALEAQVELARDGAIVRCTGTLTASVTQACVATGEPVPATVAEAFALRFVPDSDAASDDEVELQAGDLDEIGYSGGSVDVGEAAAQTLDLALDPFPRAEGADAALREAGVIGEEDTGPFAALKQLRDRL